MNGNESSAKSSKTQIVNGNESSVKGSKTQLSTGESSLNPLNTDILLALRSTFKNDYCKIAKAFNATVGELASKTCLEVN